MRLFAVILLAIVTLSPAYAAVDAQSIDLPDGREFGAVTSVRKFGLKPQFSLPTDRDVYVFYFAGAACDHVAVLARSSVDPRKLAGQLEYACQRTLFEGKRITWGRNKKYSAAMVSYSTASFGQISSTANAPVGKLMAGLRGAGLNARGILRIGRYAETRGIVFNQRGTALYHWYDISSVPNDLVASVSAKVARRDMFNLLRCFVVVPVVIVLSVLGAVAVGRTQRISVERRRWLCSKIISYPAVVAAAVQLLLIARYTRGSSAMVIGDLWNGALRPSPLVGIAMILAMLLAFSSFPLGGAVERRLLGPREDDEEVAEMRRAMRPYLLRDFGVVAALLVIVLVVRALVPWVHAVIKDSTLLTIFSMALWFVFMRWVSPEQFGVFPSGKEDPELTARARRIADQMGVKVKKVTVFDNKLARDRAGACVLRCGHIVVTRKLLEASTPDELDFILAHEAAHLVGKNSRRELAVLPLAVLAVAAFVIVIRSEPTGWALSWLLVPLAIVVCLCGFELWLSRGTERRADRLALQTTRDLASAVSGLRKLVELADSPKSRDRDTFSSHPKLSARVENLREAAREMGIASE